MDIRRQTQTRAGFELLRSSDSHYEDSYGGQEDAVPENTKTCAGIDGQMNKKTETAENATKENTSDGSTTDAEEASIVEVVMFS